MAAKKTAIAVCEARKLFPLVLQWLKTKSLGLNRIEWNKSKLYGNYKQTVFHYLSQGVGITSSLPDSPDGVNPTHLLPQAKIAWTTRTRDNINILS